MKTSIGFSVETKLARQPIGILDKTGRQICIGDRVLLTDGDQEEGDYDKEILIKSSTRFPFGTYGVSEIIGNIISE